MAAYSYYGGYVNPWKNKDFLSKKVKASSNVMSTAPVTPIFLANLKGEDKWEGTTERGGLGGMGNMILAPDLVPNNNAVYLYGTREALLNGLGSYERNLEAENYDAVDIKKRGVLVVYRASVDAKKKRKHFIVITTINAEVQNIMAHKTAVEAINKGVQRDKVSKKISYKELIDYISGFPK